MVRKSSSSFLRKLAMNFDDKDAPPIPVIPMHSNHSTVSHQSSSSASISNSYVSNITTLPSLPKKSNDAGLGPLDDPVSNSLDNVEGSAESALATSLAVAEDPHVHPESAASAQSLPSSQTPIPIPKKPTSTDLDMGLDQELSNSVSTVESWLKRSHLDDSSRADVYSTSTPSNTSPALDSPAAPNDSSITATMTESSETPLATTLPATIVTGAAATLIAPQSNFQQQQTLRPPQGFRRPSHASTISTVDDDDSESEDIAVPISSVLSLSSNRLSKIYETSSFHLSESQASLYYSAKPTLSDDPDQQQNNDVVTAGANADASVKVPLVANAARNSIRFSEFGLMAPTNKELPAAPPTLQDLFGAESGERPLPRRPVSLFVPLTTAASAMATDKYAQGGESERITQEDQSITPDFSVQSNPALVIRRSSNRSGTELRPAGHLNIGTMTLSVPGSGSAGARPATICVSPEEANKVAVAAGVTASAVSVTITPLITDFSLSAPTESKETLAKRNAKLCFREDDTFLRRDEISIYLGQAKPFNRMVLNYYMDHFDFSGKRLDAAFRQLCQKLVLKGETQEVDRVLEAFAQRFVDCNPRSIFGSKDVVHAITYSILLLNTDLHVVQQSNSSKMSRSAFVKNTLQVVQAQTLQQQEERASEDSSAHGIPFTRTATGDLSVNGYGHGPGGKKKTPSIKSWKSGASHQSKSSKMGLDPKANGGHGNGKWWMSELETLLKEIYTTVKHHQILLPTASSSTGSGTAPTTPTSSSFPHSTSGPSGSSSRSSPGSSGFLPRLSRQVQPSALADAGFSVSGSSGHGHGHGTSGSSTNGPLFGGMGRRNSINARTKQLRQEAMQRLNAQAAEGGYPSPPTSLSSHSSFTHHSVAPEGKKTTNESLRPGNGGRASTLTPPSSSSSQHTRFISSPLPSPVSSVFSHPETVIQPQPSSTTGPISNKHSHPGYQARFRMEGILFRKHLLERADKKASHRAWKQLLVVLDQGGLSLFRADGQLGQAFEEQGILFDEIRLQHTITNILPPPGYSSSRRHVFAVQLHTGAVYLFQAATAHECEEWARTCNYWAARTSKEPLQGGVVNMDYGWGRSLDLLANSDPLDGNNPGGLSAAAQVQAQSTQMTAPSMPHSNTMTSTVSGLSISSMSSSSAVTESTVDMNAAQSTSERPSVMPIGDHTSSGSSLAVPTLTTSSSNVNSEDEDAKSVHSSTFVGTNYLEHPPPLTSTLSSSSISSSHSGQGSEGRSFSFGNSGVGSGRSASIKSTSSKHSGVGGMHVPLGDRVTLFEWAPPLPTMSMSQLNEEEQCEGLKRHVAGLEAEMEVHQEHRTPMMRLFQPRSHNYTKAFNNWERRSRHLLKEMVKYQIYVECLEQSLQFQRAAEAEDAARSEEELQHLDVEEEEEGEEEEDDEEVGKEGQDVEHHPLEADMENVATSAA
ncbi:hypothetical protein EDD11_005529 [Mortierella claussenii]|nr:hypothetical protein EDD11_005529 [Mortierella claussenii]